ncbi:hypothetical protein OPT61_g529 [Boeremia exigua]|uniref:Uncharacterized protein n=1 Tax=Boeremia exigua TaxID=749465 RepID=A0ACC2ITS5_9PLEO|nr:hypothetical protein OPT61_g529 [Boeremia exigua]
MLCHTIPLIIDGVHVLPSQKQPAPLFRPETNAYNAHEPSAVGATPDLCTQAADSCARAYLSWRETHPAERRRLFNKLAQLLENKSSELEDLIQEEISCTTLWARINVADSIAIVQQCAANLATGVLSGVVPIVRDSSAHAVVIKEPLGVVLAIAPWNAPLILGVRAVAAAVGAGNTAILKGSEMSPMIHFEVAKLFQEAGFPPGVVNYVQHRPQDASACFEAMISHPAVQKCNFTGSTPVGRHIAQRAGYYLKPVTLELGGKNFALVMKDADLEQAADQVLFGSFLNSGQICMATDLVLIDRSVEQAFVDLIREKMSVASKQVVRTINSSSEARIDALLHNAIKHGAISVTDDLELTTPAAVVTGVTSAMEFWRVESFGPLLGLVSYDREEEAVRVVNNSSFGLSAAIFSRDHFRAFNLAKRLNTGAVHVNSATVHDEATLPHGGRKESGWGRFGAHWGFEEFLQTKNIIIHPDPLENMEYDYDAQQLASVPSTFPQQPQFSGFMKPCRFEGNIDSLEVRGQIPDEIDGTFYRVMPDPQLPPFWFNGDGNISAFRIRGGRCNFQQRYVRTEKFLRERKAGRSLAGRARPHMQASRELTHIGKYRNKFTDAVEFKIRTTANTTVLHFNGRLLACKEDAPPYSLDLNTLETRGLEDFDSQLPCLTFTAHPKYDSATKELVCFGYEAKGDGTPDVCYFTIDPNEKLVETVWLISPIVAMIHDFAITENWVLFPIIPQTCDLERMKQGGEHWQWSPDVPFYLGVLPRRGASGTDVKWFRAPNAFPGHTVNAYENDAGDIVLDLPLSDKNVFFWWPDANGNAPDPREIKSDLVRFTFDPRSDNLDLPVPKVLVNEDCEFPRINDNFSGKKHKHVFMDVMDPDLGTDFVEISPKMGGGFPPYNCIAHLDCQSLQIEKYFPGRNHLVQEPVFIARRGADIAEEDGWVMALVNNYSSMSSELHIIDTRDFKRPQAIVDLPIRLRAGLHGNWVDTVV